MTSTFKKLLNECSRKELIEMKKELDAHIEFIDNNID